MQPNIIKVNLGAGLQAYEHLGYISVDKIKSDGIDIVWDCEMGLPRVTDKWGDIVYDELPIEQYRSGIQFVARKVFEDNTVGEFLCKHFLEHLSNDGFMRLMDEMYDALKPDGRLIIHVPNTEHRKAARGDPTHKMEFHETTFDYFTHEILAAFPYTKKAWKILKREVRGTPPDDLWEIYVEMQPDK